jgi:hypothetical protein
MSGPLFFVEGEHFPLENPWAHGYNFFQTESVKEWEFVESGISDGNPYPAHVA